ncbi:hypothetical protein RchiOBHm_Chr7g0232661 [Rosa chinensis]|uniref:Uncharacterized protein n=1 Tax=Rosa chinensis TaxID=74649 RepID=A0A2P6PFZ0_ROSCH|nr:hypothetical protein RchiOBHm_Chr7g0232661 [Rosa chinensis]
MVHGRPCSMLLKKSGSRLVISYFLCITMERQSRSRCGFFTGRENSWHYKGCRNSCCCQCSEKENSNSDGS